MANILLSPLFLGCMAVILLAIVGVCSSPFLRFRAKKETIAPESSLSEKEECPPVSILMLSDRDAEKLDRRIDAVLSQGYPQAFEIIVVTEKDHSEVQDVIKLKENDSRVRSTFIPATSRYMSKPKLAITLGVKSAAYEWIVILGADAMPIGTNWLKNLASGMDSSKNIVAGYCNYAPERSHSYHRFEKLFLYHYLFRWAKSGHTYAANGTNFAFRKSEFIEQDGYRGNLQYVRGEFDFLVNKYSSGKASLVISPEAWAIDEESVHKYWINDHLAYLYHYRKLRRNTKMHMLILTDMICLHASVVGIVAAIVFSIYQQIWGLTAVASLLLVGLSAFRIWYATRSIQAFNANISTWKVPFLELGIAWHWALYRIYYIFSDKINYSSHKL